ncbi:MAG TPA: peptidoglycan editing factor PgeF [Nitrospirae bacterium]|nr:peptidoglycan editing factor PgeF [Nitrospirota bacterium]
MLSCRRRYNQVSAEGIRQGNGLQDRILSRIISPGIFRRSKIKAFFTTKKSASAGRTISALTDIPENRIYKPVQKHTDNVIVVGYDMKPRVADAVLTRRKGILVGVSVADCVPVLVYDPVRMVCGSVHAGWRGTAKGILKNTLDVMTGEFFSNPSDIIMAIGPAIRWCCYSVGIEVLESVMSSTGDGDYHTKSGNRICLDLSSANRQQALSMGVDESKIWMSDECTYCYPERYYSYRYSRGSMGRQGGFIGMFTD